MSSKTFVRSRRTEDVAKRSIWDQCKKKYILTTDRRPTNDRPLNFENFKRPYLREGLSDPLHVYTADATQLSSSVASASVVWTEFATNCTTTADGFNRQFRKWQTRLHIGVTTWLLIDIDIKYRYQVISPPQCCNDVIMSSLVSNLITQQHGKL